MAKGYNIGYKVGSYYKKAHQLFKSLFTKRGLPGYLGTLSFAVLQIVPVFLFYHQILAGIGYLIGFFVILSLLKNYEYDPENRHNDEPIGYKNGHSGYGYYSGDVYYMGDNSDD